MNTILSKNHHVLSNIACNAILRDYVNSANFSQAIHLFNHLTTKLGFVPDNHTCPLILKACSGLCDLDEGRKVHDLINRLSSGYFKPNVYTKCALIDMFAKCGSLDEAQKVFDDMSHQERDLPSWTALICGTIHHGHSLKALSLFKMMRCQGTSPDSVVVAAIIPACGRLETSRQTGMALQAFALTSGFNHDLFVSNAIMDMYCKFGDTHQAYNIFSRMLNKDVVSWSTLIVGYSQNFQYGRSLELYSEMIDQGIKPSAIAVASALPALGKLKFAKQGGVMHGYILKQGFDFDVVVGSALMEMYSNCGLIVEMETLFSKWLEWDVMIWNSAISGYASVEKYIVALSIFRKIWEFKIKPNSITFISILPICTKMGALKQGMEVHGYAIKTTFKMSVSVCNSIIDMYCKCGYLELGLKVFDHMMEKDIVSYNTIISAYGFHGYGKQALLVYNEMKSLAIKPGKVTFVGLLSACSHSGLVDEAWTLYNSMVNHYGLKPTVEHYSCMVDLLGRAGRIDDACNFIRMMPHEPNVNIVLGCLLAACQVHNKMELAVLLAKEILQQDIKVDDDSGYHILLSNIYASTKKWKDASRIRVLVKEKGLQKKPGKSCIQIGHCTHTFEARDTTHPEFKKIEQVLLRLFVEMKEEWHEEGKINIV